MQSGAELAYLCGTIQNFEASGANTWSRSGKRVRLKDNVKLLAEILSKELGQARLSSSSYRRVRVRWCNLRWKGMRTPENVFGTEFGYGPVGRGDLLGRAGYQPAMEKLLSFRSLSWQFGTRPDHTIYIGDGSLDLHVMHHVNSRDGHTIAVSETKDIGPNRKAGPCYGRQSRRVFSCPILEDNPKMGHSGKIREFFEAHGLSVQGWDKTRMDWLTFHKTPAKPRETVPAKVSRPNRFGLILGEVAHRIVLCNECSSRPEYAHSGDSGQSADSATRPGLALYDLDYRDCRH